MHAYIHICIFFPRSFSTISYYKILSHRLRFPGNHCFYPWFQCLWDFCAHPLRVKSGIPVAKPSWPSKTNALGVPPPKVLELWAREPDVGLRTHSCERTSIIKFFSSLWENISYPGEVDLIILWVHSSYPSCGSVFISLVVEDLFW